MGFDMRKYIFITGDIHPIGGMQNYVEGKAKYLEKNGWKVSIFFDGRNKNLCKIQYLDKYIDGGILELALSPAEYPSIWRNHVLNKMKKAIGEIGEEIIIESSASSYALWGELLAEDIGAKHFCFICNEEFRAPQKYYLNKIDFFDFKHKRREIAGIHNNSLSMLFEGYKDVSAEDNFVFVAANEGPVQDVNNPKIDLIKSSDWTICYIGRSEKGYFPEILKGIRKFSSENCSKRIQVVFVGDVSSRREMIKKTIIGLDNVSVVLLGDLVPIPRELFSRIDVVIAGSGCAFCAANEGVTTIIADAKNYKANGVYGIDTFSILFAEKDNPQYTYESILQKVLVDGVYKNKKPVIEKHEKIDVQYSKHMSMVKASTTEMEYYNRKKLCSGNIRFKKIVKYKIYEKMPWLWEFIKDVRK